MPTVVASGQNAYVSFTDGQGSAELVTAAGQFDGWTPNAEDIGTVDVAIGTGYTFKYIYRTDYTASFVISAIPAASMPIAQRLKRWLESGGTVTVATQDTQGNTYSCRIAPRQQVKFGYDATMLEYAMTLAVLNTAASPMTCIYQASAGTGYTIVVTPSTLTLSAGTGAIPLTAVVTDSAGNVVSLPVTWSTSAASVATVLSTGAETASVTPVGAGNCTITAALGSLAVSVPVAVAANNTPAAITASPSSLPFTQTTYSGTPQVGVSGVPAQTITATILNSADTTLPYTVGALTWACTNPNFALVDNLNGTATVQPTKGGQTGTVTITNPATGVQTTVSVTSVASAGPVAMVPSQAQITLTAVGQQVSPTVTSIDQYGIPVS